MLKEANFKPLYATGEDEPYDFYFEGLINSNKLDLGLGYFSSSAIRDLSIGFAFFIKKGGKMRIIINNVLSKEDKEAIQNGSIKNLNWTVEDNIINDILQLRKVLSKRDEHFFKCLSYLISQNRIEIKATVPKKNKAGIVHQKFGLFKDDAGDAVAFTGSVNFSSNALFNNVEDLVCDCSWWGHDVITARIKHFDNIFSSVWLGNSEVVQIIPIDRVRAIISDQYPAPDLETLCDEELQLLEDIQEYTLPHSYIEKVKGLEAQLVSDRKSQLTTGSNVLLLRAYQLDAIENWRSNHFKGLLEMATGTGKTITALAAIDSLKNEIGRVFTVIACPFIHLAEQWIDEAKKFGHDGIFVGESKKVWVDQVAREAQLFKKGKISSVLLVTTNDSFKSSDFQKIISTCLENLLLIVDEAHYAGSYTIRTLLPVDCKYRLGLSATPTRHGDDEGTFALFDYFDKVVFKFPIEEAIGKFLTPYYYYPIPIELTDAEFEEYTKLSNEIVWYVGKTDESSLKRLEYLTITRARLQNNSSNKLEWIKKNIKNYPVDFSLFYSGEQSFSKLKTALGKIEKIRIHEFTSKQSRSQRKKLLKEFAEQKIQSLLAMKCLDEGVDVPPTRIAYFLASSSNPREFIQRRGRVLRKSPGKSYATIYDLISIPPKKAIELGRKNKEYHAVKSAFIKEYKRVQEFASMAINKYDSINELFNLADHLDLLDITKESK